MITTTTLALLLLSMGMVASCSSINDNQDVQPSVAIVYGVVSNQAQEPIAGADVAIEAFPGTCDTGEPLASDRTTTDATGSYRKLVGGPHVRRFDACVAVRVTPPSGTNYQEATRHGAMVTFVHEANTPPIDSIRVDIDLVQR